jgi:hypothetical protein
MGKNILLTLFITLIGTLLYLLELRVILILYIFLIILFVIIKLLTNSMEKIYDKHTE